MNKQFQHDGQTYEMVLPAVAIKNKRFTREDILAEENTEVREALVAHAWQGPEGRRDEDEFSANGIFKLVYAALAE